MDLISLPTEILICVSEYLNLRDTCILSSTCSQLDFDTLATQTNKLAIKVLKSNKYSLALSIHHCISKNKLLIYKTLTRTLTPASSEKVYRDVANLMYINPLTGNAYTHDPKYRRKLVCELLGNVNVYVKFLVDLHKLYLNTLDCVCSLDQECLYKNTHTMIGRSCEIIDVLGTKCSWIYLFIQHTLHLWYLAPQFSDFYYNRCNNDMALDLVLLVKHYSIYKLPCQRFPPNLASTLTVVDRNVFEHIVLNLSNDENLDILMDKCTPEFFEYIIENDAHKILAMKCVMDIVFCPYIMKILGLYLDWSSATGGRNNVCDIIMMLYGANRSKDQGGVGGGSVVVIPNCQLCQVKMAKVGELKEKYISCGNFRRS